MYIIQRFQISLKKEEKKLFLCCCSHIAKFFLCHFASLYSINNILQGINVFDDLSYLFYNENSFINYVKSRYRFKNLAQQAVGLYNLIYCKEMQNVPV